MNNKLLIIILFFTFLLQPYMVTAQTPTKTSTPLPTDASTLDSLSKQISDLKEKIASRVASMNLVEKRGFIGTVTDSTNTQITLHDLQGNIRFVDIDEITKFASPTAKEKGTFGISDISKGTTIHVLGLYNKQSRRTLARFITVVTPPVFISGTVSNISSTDFTIDVTDEKETYVIDIENTTRTKVYEDDEVVRSGFSQLKEGEKVVIVGYLDKDEKNRLQATYILRLPILSGEEPEITEKDTVSPTQPLSPTRRPTAGQ